MFNHVDLGEKWGWYNAMWALADGKAYRINDIEKMEFMKSLAALSYMKDLNANNKTQE